MDRTQALCRNAGTTVIMVTHDVTQALSYGDRLIVLRDGTIAADLGGAEKSSLTVSDVIQMCGFRHTVGLRETQVWRHDPT